jgi:transposase
VIHELPESKRICPKCGKPFADFPGTEDSEELDYEERVFRRVHKRKRYRRTCQCKCVPGIVAAPVPRKLIPKGKLSIGLWVYLLLEKYLDQRPLYRTLRRLSLHGVDFSQGTITGGLGRIGELIQPLYVRILERCRSAGHWHMDETRWKVFVEWLGKKGYGWWLWIVMTKDTCVYLLDPARSGDVPKDFLGENAEGVISADRYSAYKTLLSVLIRIAYCWAHVRRDFLRIRNGYGKLRDWATAWVDRIDGLFHRNARRLGARADPAGFSVEDQALLAEMETMAKVRDRELADEALHPAARKALESLENHWEGLRIFVDHPEIPMDNNRAERGLRNPVIGRKNYYGSGSVWSGMFTVMMFTLLQTLLLNDINPKDFLQAYFEACAENGGRVPENLDAFLPWKSSEEEPRAA